MGKDDKEVMAFLQGQIEWCKEQDAILEKIERKLYEMKEIAEYRTQHEVTAIEIEHLNQRLQELGKEVQMLEGQLSKGNVH